MARLPTDHRVTGPQAPVALYGLLTDVLDEMEVECAMPSQLRQPSTYAQRAVPDHGKVT
jgi:hypothetical protein